MSDEHQFNLDEAIREFYKIEPLKIDLASSVSRQIFIKKELPVSSMDFPAHLAIVIIGLVILFLSAHRLNRLNLSPVMLLLVIPVFSYFWLSAKETSAYILSINRNTTPASKGMAK